MTAPHTAALGSREGVGERVELARYDIDGITRIVVGQRVNGVLRVSDVPAAGGGRAYLVERGLEHDGNAALRALADGYIRQARLHAYIPATVPVECYLAGIQRRQLGDVLAGGQSGGDSDATG